MLRGYHPLFQTLLGTLLTWGLTALGAALVFVFQGGQVSEGSLNVRPSRQIMSLVTACA